MAPHSNILAWSIPWAEEPRGLQSMGLQRLGHNFVTDQAPHPHNCFKLLYIYNLKIRLCTKAK